MEKDTKELLETLELMCTAVKNNPCQKDSTFFGYLAKTIKGFILSHFDMSLTQAPYNDILIVDLSATAPTGTTGTLPVYFKTGNNARVAVTKAGGVALTAADIASTGYYLFFYDRASNTIQTFNSVV